MSRRRHLLCSDLDGTLLGDEAALERFRLNWERFSRRTAAALAYVTGRGVGNVLRLLETTPALPLPDAIAGDVGTTLHLVGEGRRDERHAAALAVNWAKSSVEAIAWRQPALHRQHEENQSEFKSSWTIDGDKPDPVPALRRALAEAGLACHVVRSAGTLLDILPANGGKGAAVTRLAEIFGVPHDGVLVAGDTGNDTDMFRVPGVRGVLVANAHEEIRRELETVTTGRIHLSESPYAAGVIEGCRRAFGGAFDAE